MTTLERLERGVEILSDPKNWTRGAYHRRNKHCMLGACGYDSETRRFDPSVWDVEVVLTDAIRRVFPDFSRGRPSVSGFNDNRPYEDVMLVLRDAIKFERQKGGL